MAAKADPIQSTAAFAGTAATAAVGDTLRSTIAPPQRGPDTAGTRAMALLTELSNERGLGLGRALVLEKTLGQGGMGVVHLATQTAFDRKVAVKTLRKEQRSEPSTMQLLREAWVTGKLEHPNIVPVYDIALDENQQPFIVMRRIEGIDWATVITDPAAIAAQFATTDALEWNLGVLMQVCNAVQFAHERGVLHRDLKPDNVRIGPLGEVYLLDWGIAVALENDGSGRLPLVTDVAEIAGTPCYMAPEMFFVEVGKLGPRTDVYLLGAILFEMLVGHPPHNGETLPEVADQIQRTVRMPAQPRVPGVLRAICERALAKEPSDRFESALELRNALREYLRARGSMTLVEASQKKVEELKQRADAGATSSELHNLFSQCRFGFQQAIASWPDNRVARDELHAITEWVVRYEIRHGDLNTAAVLLAELNPAPADLVKLLDGARARAAEEAARRQKLETLGKDHDASIGQRTRTALGVGFSVGWGLLSLARYIVTPNYERLTYFSAGIVLTVVTIGVLLRKSLFATRFNATMYAAIVVTTVAQLVLYPAASALGVPFGATDILPLLLYFFGSALTAFVADRRMLWAALGFLTAFVVAVVLPQSAWIGGALSNVFLGIIIYSIWGDQRYMSKGPMDPC